MAAVTNHQKLVIKEQKLYCSSGDRKSESRCQMSAGLVSSGASEEEANCSVPLSWLLVATGGISILG